MSDQKELKVISDELHSLQDKLDSTNKAIVGLQSKGPAQIEIVHVAPDYFAATIALVATFLGAYLAYQINALGEKLKDRRAQIDKINYAINTLILNLNVLLNFKRQFLADGEKIIDAMKAHVGKYTTQQPSNPAKNYWKSIKLNLENGLLRFMQEILMRCFKNGMNWNSRSYSINKAYSL